MQLPSPRRVSPSDPDWPTRLNDLADPPLGFDLVGELDDAPKVGIVGTRRADASSNRFAHQLAHELADKGVTIVSGGASGIDASAHAGALEVGRTIAVLATDFSRPYPRNHGPLFERIAARGALIHEDHPAKSRNRFLVRNRIIAALSDVVVVVQAPIKSGALGTAAHARAIDRPLFVVPVAPWDRRGAGNLALLQKGASLCFSSASVLATLGLEGRREMAPRGPASGLMEFLTSEPRTLDALASATGRAVAELHVELLRLTLSGAALETPEGWIAT